MSLRRTYADLGWQVKRLRVLLKSEDWDELIGRAAAMGMDLATYCGHLLSLVVVEQYRTPTERARVYYDAQGREHEEADVR